MIRGTRLRAVENRVATALDKLKQSRIQAEYLRLESVASQAIADARYEESQVMQVLLNKCADGVDDALAKMTSDLSHRAASLRADVVSHGTSCCAASVQVQLCAEPTNLPTSPTMPPAPCNAKPALRQRSNTN